MYEKEQSEVKVEPVVLHDIQECHKSDLSTEPVSEKRKRRFPKQVEVHEEEPHVPGTIEVEPNPALKYLRDELNNVKKNPYQKEKDFSLLKTLITTTNLKLLDLHKKLEKGE